MKTLWNLSLCGLLLAVSGCATTGSHLDNLTYSGAARAAVARQASSASAYVRSLFSKPMPAWDGETAERAGTPVAAVAPPPAPVAKQDAYVPAQTQPVDLGR